MQFRVIKPFVAYNAAVSLLFQSRAAERVEGMHLVVRSHDINHVGIRSVQDDCDCVFRAKYCVEEAICRCRQRHRVQMKAVHMQQEVKTAATCNGTSMHLSDATM